MKKIRNINETILCILEQQHKKRSRNCRHIAVVIISSHANAIIRKTKRSRHNVKLVLKMAGLSNELVIRLFHTKCTRNDFDETNDKARVSSLSSLQCENNTKQFYCNYIIIRFQRSQHCNALAINIFESIKEYINNI